MNLLDLVRPRTAPVARRDAAAIERRSAPRYAVQRSVWFRRPGAVPAAGTLVNISLGGAYVRVTANGPADMVAWPLRRRAGDEVWLTGLLPDPVCCWVVAAEVDALRLRFVMDGTQREQLRAALVFWAKPGR